MQVIINEYAKKSTTSQWDALYQIIGQAYANKNGDVWKKCKKAMRMDEDVFNDKYDIIYTKLKKLSNIFHYNYKLIHFSKYDHVQLKNEDENGFIPLKMKYFDW